MILGAGEIKKRIQAGSIEISPFDSAKLNPNSYDLSLDGKLMILECGDDGAVDIKKPPKYKEIVIGDDGIVLEKDKVYLASTIEYTKTKCCVPIIFGKSSLSRLGLAIHCTGGFGDIGFEGNWTLSLKPSVNTRVYAGIKICQIVYFDVALGGESRLYDSKKYQDSKGVVTSKYFKEFE